MTWSPWVTDTRARVNAGTLITFYDLQYGYSSHPPLIHYDAPEAWGNALADHNYSSDVLLPDSIFKFVSNIWQLNEHADIGSSAFLSQTAIQVTAPDGYSTYRDSYPEALWSLTEDVDFSLIPGTEDYVEYQDSASVLAGWDMPSMSVTYDSQNPGSLAEFSIHSGPVTQPFPVGTPVHSYSSPTGYSGYEYMVLPDPGPVEQFWITVRDNTRDTIPPYGIAIHASGQAYGTWFSVPYIEVILPPYRYWIPDFPLRQVQRDDGLGRSVMRARSTHSVQKSIRQRGYR